MGRLSLLLILALALAADAAPRTFAIDGNSSTASARVGKTGLGSFAGHEHTVVATNIQGEVVLDVEDLSRSSVDLIIDARSLKVREEGEPEGDAPQVQQVMRGPTVLDVARFGTIHFGSLAVTGKQARSPDAYDLAVSGELSLHGIVKPLSVAVHLEVRGRAMTASGKLVVKQTDFGMEPTTAAGGLVKVEDEVAISFRIGARAAP